jgi:amino acid permease
VGENVDAAVWVTVFIIIVTLINTFPVKVHRPTFPMAEI